MSDDDTTAAASGDEARAAAIKRIKQKREFREHVFAYVVVNAALVAIWAIGGGGYFWPGWVLGGWGIGLAFNAWNVFGQKPISEDEIQREISRGPS